MSSRPHPGAPTPARVRSYSLAWDGVEAKMSKDEFDLEAWIAGGKLPEKSVPICNRGDLMAEHETLTGQLGRAQGESKTTLARQILDVEEQVQKATRSFRVRALTAAEQAAVQGESGGQDDGFAARYLAAATVDPALSVEQVERLRAVIGEGQFVAWFNAAIAASNEKVNVPFSYAASAALSPRES